jgi:hypothetical protein
VVPLPNPCCKRSIAFARQSPSGSQYTGPRGQVIHLLRILDVDPFVGLEMRKIRILVEIVGDVLRRGNACSQNKKQEYETEKSVHGILLF